MKVGAYPGVFYRATGHKAMHHMASAIPLAPFATHGCREKIDSLSRLILDHEDVARLLPCEDKRHNNQREGEHANEYEDPFLHATFLVITS